MIFNQKSSKNLFISKITLILISLLLLPLPAYAYIGPGAGFAFLGSTFVFVLVIMMALLTLFSWPVRWIYRLLKKKGIPIAAKTRRVVILGLDGLEPSIVEKMMATGELKNMKELREEGSYSRLQTTLPALSPVAWSTFQTGVNPGAHNIFDFLTRDKRFCLPLLSSTDTEEEPRRIKIGPFELNFGKRAEVKLLRRSKPFWKILGNHGIFSNILRVPISYPPEKFEGNILSAMCTPDLRGTQGTFSLYTTHASAHKAKGDSTTGGEVLVLDKVKDGYTAALIGPPDPKNPKANLKVSFTLRILSEHEAILTVGDEIHKLKLNKFSAWVNVVFTKKIKGIARFCLRATAPEISLYVSPINVHPDAPVLPIAQPIFFTSWLTKFQGLFGTLGMMEDTWGRNELALDDERFLEQAYLTHDERENMFMRTLDKTREGVCCCVFDASDRIQHMFWRYMEHDHPAPIESEKFRDTIPEMYRRMDALLGKVRAKISPQDVLIVLSDHGFSSFRRCVALNAWLHKEGYIALKEGGSGRDYFQDVDWSKTKAFAVGLSGLYVNLKGRERQGVVSEDEARLLKKEISLKLEKLTDPRDGKRAINKVYDTATHYKGLYAKEAPDLIVGYNPGFRVSWDSVTGTVENEVFSDNTKAWSGDHHIDPELVPGIFFVNRKWALNRPHIADIAPTVLDLFSVPVPGYMEGNVLA